MAMILKEDEQIIKVFHHHYTTMFYREAKIALLSIPFFFVAYLFSGMLNSWQNFQMFTGLALIFGAVILYDGVLFWLDQLVITNMRIVYIDWKNPFSRSEHEAELTDIQDIETRETGILSFLPIFDYGSFKLETAAAHTTIVFDDAPDPEGIKHFIYHLLVKPNRINAVSNEHSDDKARQTTEETSTVSRRQ